MTGEKKKGSGGSVKAYISRGKALRKLQLTLTEFRRLCILKGIYPRNPRRKVEGSDKTYYLRKDIDFLAHERLITTIRDGSAHHKKVVKARAKRRLDLLKRLSINAPRAKLDHLIVERYPRFEDALRELDDPLCVISLFANLPAKRNTVSARRISNCQRLLREFCQYVVQTRALTRAFVSIKGYYFQAKVCGIKVTWITPHRFTQNIPHEVDFSVLSTFLELYECMLSFVNFRLYTNENLAYPPKRDRNSAANALELGSLLLETSSGNKAGPNIEKRRKAAQTPNLKPQVGYDIIKQAEQIARDAAREEEDDDEEEIDVVGNVVSDVVGDGAEHTTDEESENNEGNLGNENGSDTKETADEESNEDEDNINDNDDETQCKDDEFKKLVTNTNGISECKTEDAMNVDQAAIDELEKATTDDVAQEIIPSGVFFGKSVVLGREVPFFELEFVLKAAGACLVTREDDLVEKKNLSGFTHWIIDRPAVVGDRNMSLEYVQPQYVFDSVNAGLLLPTSLYAPGAHLPPHLSPFITAADNGGYKPWYEDVVERIKKGDPSVVDEAAATVYAEGEAMAKKAEIRKSNTTKTADDDNVVSNGDKIADINPSGRESDISDESGNDSDDVREKEEDSEGEEEKVGKVNQEKMDTEAKHMASLLLSRKKLRKYNKIKGKEQRKDATKRRLMQKRQKLEEETAELVSMNPRKRARMLTS